MDIAVEMAGLDGVPADSAIYVPGADLRRLLMGIDIGEAELLLAREQGYDAAVAHHPAGGAARVGFHRVLDTHRRMLEAHGVPPVEAADAVADLALQHEVGGHAHNYDRAPSVARLLGLPFLNVHQPLDEIGRQRMHRTLEGCSAGATVADAVAALEALPEFRRALTSVAVRLGEEANPLGRWVVAHGAGTNGGYAVARAYFAHGLDTVVYIHIAPGELKRLREDVALRGKSLVVTGHLASDSLGITPYVARLREEGMEVTCIGGILEP